MPADTRISAGMQPQLSSRRRPGSSFCSYIMMPIYLKDKLSSVGINSLEELHNYDYLLVFQWLKDLYPSISYKTLFDLHCLSCGLELNSLDEQDKQALKASYAALLPHYAPLAQDVVNKYLQLALEQGQAKTTEIPIGAVIVKNGEVVGRGHNQTISSNNISYHAEILAIAEASSRLGTHRLDGCDLFVTIEPCLMCAGAILHSRLKRVVFGAVELKTGAIISQYKVLENQSVNKHTEAVGPVDNITYARQLQQFMLSRR